MLAIVIQVILSFFICFNFSFFFLTKTKIIFKNPVKYILFGLFPIAILIRIWHLFLPINEYTLVLFLFVSILIYINYKAIINCILFDLKKLILENKFTFILASFLTIYFSSLTSISYDEGLYHAGFISWVNKYKIINGLANIESRFGFNSNWHLLDALFNGYHILPNISNSINTFIALVFTLYFLSEKNSRWIILFIFFPIIIIYHLIDPSADFVIYLFTIALVVDLFKERERDLFWIFAFLFLVTVKINALILFPLLVIYYMPFFKKVKKYPIAWTPLLLFSFFLFGPWIYANFLLSGYLIFPYFEINSISPIWKLDAIEVINTMNGISFTPFCKYTGISLENATNYNKFQQFFLWFRDVRIIDKLLFLFSLSSILGLIFQRRKNKMQLISSLFIFLIFIIYVIMVPDPRFFLGIGFAAFICMLFNYPLILNIVNSHRLIAIITIIQFSVTLYLYVNLYPKILSNQSYSLFNPIYKAGYQYSPSIKKSIDGVKFSIPIGNEFNWDVSPAILKEKTSLKKIGHEINDGFYNTPTVHKK